MKTRPHFDNHIIVVCLLVLAVTLVPAIPVGATGLASSSDCVIRVDAASTAVTQNGLDWEHAIDALQAGMNQAYMAIAGSSGSITSCQVWVKRGFYKPNGGRTGYFVLMNGVSVYGGFAGTEGNLSERILSPANTTYISGDLDGDGRDDNDAYNVIQASYASAYQDSAHPITLDGVTITSGNANETTTWTWPRYNGGGMAVTNSNLKISNVIFTGNYGYYGGAVYSQNSILVFDHVTFQNNFAYNGAGIYMLLGNTVDVMADFDSNYATNWGGGLYEADNSNNLSVHEGQFHNNYAGGAGGGAFIADDAIFDKVNFLENGQYESANTQEGGALYIGLGVNPATILLSNDSFTNNNADYGGAVYIYRAAPTIVNGLFAYNHAAYEGSALLASTSSNPTLTNVTISENSTTRVNGGAIYLSQDCYPFLQNTILWNDSNGEISGDIEGDPSQATFQYSMAEGCNPGGAWNNACGANGGGNPADKDPLFVNPATADFRLKTFSPVVNIGSNVYINGMLLDLNGATRIFNQIVDLGAYEYQGAWLLLPISFRP